jgi:ABC-type branched-subunit amino acid transport system substrate-binding protein
VDVYASLPLRGPRAIQAAGILNGIRLALTQAHGRAGRWRVRLIALDDSIASGAGWDAGRTARNARAAASDPAAVYYIGDLDSSASQISGPILNAAGVPQVSPLSTYPGLTASPPGVAGPMDPTGTPTFLRLDPSDSVQAAAQLAAAGHARCARVALIHDETLEGAGLAAQLEARRGQDGVQVPSDERLSVAEQAPGAYAARIKAQGVRCLLFAGISSPGAARLVSSVEAAYPRLLEIIGSDGVCTAPFTRPGASGLSPGAAAAFRCTSPASDLHASRTGRAFVAAYGAAYHTTIIDPLAVYGYEAMSLALATISGLGGRGNDKEAVRDALFATGDRHSAIGTYGFDREGNTTASSYGLYRVGRNGAPEFVQELTP